MDIDPTSLSRQFFDCLDIMSFPQPIVANVIGCDQTELNELRRSNLMTEGWKKNGRVVYTGRGLLIAGVMMELAWLLRPREAANYAIAFNDWFDQCVKDDRKVWSQRVAHFRRPIFKRGDDNLARLAQSSDGADDGLGRVIRFTYRAEMERENALPVSTSMLLPVGRLVDKWSIDAMRQLEKIEGGSA